MEAGSGIGRTLAGDGLDRTTTGRASFPRSLEAWRNPGNGPVIDPAMGIRPGR